MRKFSITGIIKVLLALFIGIGIFGTLIYLDYSIYKAKYPNTTLWMYLLD